MTPLKSSFQVLAEDEMVICKELTQGKLLDDVAWLAKLHGEKMARKVSADKLFPDSLCEVKFVSIFSE